MDQDSTLPYFDSAALPSSTCDVPRHHEAALGSRYSVLRKLGEGGMGSVYLAEDRELGRLVAVKFSKPGADIDRQQREAQALAKIDSPYVTTVYDFQRPTQNDVFVAMQYVEGDDLHQMISNDGRQSPEDVHTWMSHIAEGMSAAERIRIVHRDLKPANILIDRQGQACATDFGLSLSSTDPRLTQSGFLLGTPSYMAPEQAEDPRAADTRSDIYSFGATFYHAITGRPPFTGKSFMDVLLKHKLEPVQSPKNLVDSLPPLINDCIERSLAKRPLDRFQSFDEISELLNDNSQANAWGFATDRRLIPILQDYEKFRSCLTDASNLKEGQRFEAKLPNGKSITILVADLTRQKVDAIVSSDDGNLTMGGGVSAAIRYAAGPEIDNEANRYIPVRHGRVVVTSAGRLPIRFIMHGVTIGVGDEQTGPTFVRPSRDIIAEIVDSCLYHSETLSLKSIAFPLLGTGMGLLSREEALDTIFRVLLSRLLKGASPLVDVRIVLFDKSKK